MMEHDYEKPQCVYISRDDSGLGKVQFCCECSAMTTSRARLQISRCAAPLTKARKSQCQFYFPENIELLTTKSKRGAYKEQMRGILPHGNSNNGVHMSDFWDVRKD